MLVWTRGPAAPMDPTLDGRTMDRTGGGDRGRPSPPPLIDNTVRCSAISRNETHRSRTTHSPCGDLTLSDLGCTGFHCCS